MKKDIHPSNYREVCFKDMSNEEVFITRSTVASRETIEIDGKEYPLVKLEEVKREPIWQPNAGRIDKIPSRIIYVFIASLSECYLFLSLFEKN